MLQSTKGVVCDALHSAMTEIKDQEFLIPCGDWNDQGLFYAKIELDFQVLSSVTYCFKMLYENSYKESTSIGGGQIRNYEGCPL